jgi:hypothetical protein
VWPADRQALADWTRPIEHDVDEIRWVTQWCLPLLGREGEAIAAYAAVVGRRRIPELMRTLAAACRLALERQHDDCLAAIETVDEQGFDPEGRYFAARALVRSGEHDRAMTSSLEWSSTASLLRPHSYAIPGWTRFEARCGSHW